MRITANIWRLSLVGIAGFSLLGSGCTVRPYYYEDSPRYARDRQSGTPDARDVAEDGVEFGAMSESFHPSVQGRNYCPRTIKDRTITGSANADTDLRDGLFDGSASVHTKGSFTCE